MNMKHQRRPQPPAAAVLALAAAMALPAPLLAQQAAKPAAQSPALKSSARVTLNFVNAEIEAVSRAMAAMIERQIVVECDVIQADVETGGIVFTK